MAANSDGNIGLSAILTCEGDLSDPRFPTQLNILVNSLNNILGNSVKIHKLEPWNSVRVTLSISKEAALRLRQLANEGSQHLRSLGILSVEVEGDQVISLQLVTAGHSEPQEIILRTSQDGSNSDSTHEPNSTNFLQTNATSSPTSSSSSIQLQFKSPNVVCPADSVVPKVEANIVSPNISGSNKAFAGPFPFASMNQAIHSNRETSFNSLPPHYPAKHTPVTISSPLLVNLLQNDGAKETSASVEKSTPLRTSVPSDVSTTTVNSLESSSSSNFSVKPNNAATAVTSSAPTTTSSQANMPQANMLINNSMISQTALSTNTSIGQNSTVMTSTTGMVVNKPPSPPLYHRAVSSSMVKQSPAIAQQTINSRSSPLQSTVVSHETQSAAVSLQQNNAYKHQLAMFSSQLKNSTPANIVTPLAQPNSISKVKHPISHKPVVSPNFPKSVSLPVNMPLAKNIPQRSIHPNLLNHPNNTHVKLEQSNMSLAKTPMYLPQQIKNNFSPDDGGSVTTSLPPSVSSVTMPFPGTLDLPTSSQSFNNINFRKMPSPPPYSVAISQPTSSLLDLTPTLTHLKTDDLDEILPNLERELGQDLPQDFLAVHSNVSPIDDLQLNDNRKFLINPLTGELEPQSSEESDSEELKDVFTGLPSPANLSDDDTCSNSRPDTTTDQSDSETRFSDTTLKPIRLKNSKPRERDRDCPALLKQEKIKLRLKLEKSEPINQAYKVDVSFINQQPKKASSSLITAGEELRVPPLHISLRGRNSAVIKNKNKSESDGSSIKVKVKNSDPMKIEKREGNNTNSMEDASNINSLMMDIHSSMLAAEIKSRLVTIEQKKIKKLKTNYEYQELIASLTQSDLKSKFVIHNHYKEKQKERRGSDSELVKTKKKFERNASEDKKRRLSQSEQQQQLQEEEQPVLGSTNVGTISGLPQKVRKDKVKIKDAFKKDASKSNKLFNKNFGEKLQNKLVTLPTAGEMNMEAKFKQGLLEGTSEKSLPRPPHWTEIINHLSAESNRIETAEVVKVIPEIAPIKDVSPESDKCNTPNGKSVELIDKAVVIGVVSRNRSPNSAGNQGEDSGIESMDALSEKSPNQASQSPHADILPPKIQVPNMLDIEAQLAKMEGLNGDNDRIADGSETKQGPVEDVNENKCHQDQKANKYCELACALQDSLNQGGVKLDTNSESPSNPTKKQTDINVVPFKPKKEEEDLDPHPIRVTPALYTYSNPDKSRVGLETPVISDEDSNSCSTNSTLPDNGKQSKSLLEQLLIEIPNDHQTLSSSSPVTRSSVRTRAFSKLSPELNSPVSKNSTTRVMPCTKRKRNESDSSNQSLEDTKVKCKKVVGATSADVVETATDPAIKPVRPNEPNKINNVKRVTKAHEESSDSDEPLSEKMRKSSLTVNTFVNSLAKNSSSKVVKSGSGKGSAMMVGTRRSVRGNISGQNVRTKSDNNKVPSETDALKRKTRSTVSDVRNKLKKEVK